jgi:hypothetical protein
MVAAVVLAGMLATGCSSGTNGAVTKRDTGKPAEASSTSTTTPRAPDAKPYFDAIASNDPVVMERAKASAAPGSAAALYLDYSEIADTQRGPAQITYDGGIVSICETAGAAKTCTKYSGIEVDSSNRVTRFVVGDIPLEQRIRGAGPAASTGPMTANVHVAYEANAGSLWILVDVKNIGSNDLHPYPSEAAYIAADGHQVKADGADGPQTIAPGATATVIAAFPNQKFGGSLRLTGYAGAGELAVSLPVT